MNHEKIAAAYLEAMATISFIQGALGDPAKALSRAEIEVIQTAISKQKAKASDLYQQSFKCVPSTPPEYVISVGDEVVYYGRITKVNHTEIINGIVMATLDIGVIAEGSQLTLSIKQTGE